MSSVFAPPEILSVWSCTTVDDGSGTEVLPEGTHLRIFSGLGGCFPVAPFAVLEVRARAVGLDPHFEDDDGRLLPVSQLPDSGVVLVVPELADAADVRTVAVEVLDQGGLTEVQLVDGSGRPLAVRRARPFLFSAPAVPRLRLLGDGLRSNEFQCYQVDLAEVRNGSPLAAPGLPVLGRHAWYVGADDRGTAMDRVGAGAPTQLNPMDRPDGPFPANEIGWSEEQDRVEALLAASTGDPGVDVEGLVANLVGDGSDLPWAQTDRHRLHPGPDQHYQQDQVAELPRLGALQLAAMDPGIARFLGFATRLEPQPAPQRGHVPALAVLGLVAIDRDLRDRLPHLQPWLDDDTGQDDLLELLISTVEESTGRDVDGDLRSLKQDLEDAGLLLKVALAVTSPLPPAVPPAIPTATLADQRWQASTGDSESTRFRTTFVFEQAPLGGLVAVGRQVGGDDWVPLHDQLDAGGRQRSAPRLAGHESDASRRVRGGLMPGTSASLQPAALLADHDIPSDEGDVVYRFRAADLFGRFGEGVEIAVGPPPRPGPRQPVVRHRLDLTEHPENLPGTGAVSPGSVVLTVPVPGLDQLAAGSFPLEYLVFEGEQISLPLAGETDDAGNFERTLELEGLLPQARGRRTVAASFIDSQGTESVPTELAISYRDGRPYPQLRTGIGLYWTSPPGPGPDVQLQLTWQAAEAHAQHRIYITDQAGLKLDPALLSDSPGVPPSRARIAEEGCRLVLGGARVDRGAFRLLPATVQADGQRRAVLRTTLPRSLDTVQFLRIVPMTADGTETPFERCGVLPVAVPTDRRPPPPRLDGFVDGSGTAHLSVVAEGLDAQTMRRDEPGLFEEQIPPRAVLAPGFRIRRSVQAVPDPAYGRPVVTGPLELDPDRGSDAEPVFTGRATDARPLEPFVPYTYWADVRLPDERRIPDGVDPLSTQVSAVHAESQSNRRRPASSPSPPRRLVHVPAAVPDPPDRNGVDVEWDPNHPELQQVIATIADPPLAHPLAVGPYRLAVWYQYAGGPIARPTEVGGMPLTEAWPLLEAGRNVILAGPPPPGFLGSGSGSGAFIGSMSLRLAYVDPVGRMGGITSFLLFL